MNIVSRILGGLLILSVAFGIVQSVRLDKAQDFHTAYVMKNQENLIAAYKERNEERAAAELASAQIGVEYQRGLNDAKKLNERVVASLRADNDELRNHWQAALEWARSAEASSARGSLDGTSAAVYEDIGAFVQGAAEGDGTIMSLQDQVNNYLCQINSEPFPGYRCE